MATTAGAGGVGRRFLASTADGRAPRAAVGRDRAGALADVDFLGVRPAVFVEDFGLLCLAMQWSGQETRDTVTEGF